MLQSRDERDSRGLRREVHVGGWGIPGILLF